MLICAGCEVLVLTVSGASFMATSAPVMQPPKYGSVGIHRPKACTNQPHVGTPMLLVVTRGLATETANSNLRPTLLSSCSFPCPPAFWTTQIYRLLPGLSLLCARVCLSVDCSVLQLVTGANSTTVSFIWARVSSEEGSGPFFPN
jgi:hypothetical protein